MLAARKPDPVGFSQVGCLTAEDCRKFKETAMDVRGYPTGPIDAKGASACFALMVRS